MSQSDDPLRSADYAAKAIGKKRKAACEAEDPEEQVRRAARAYFRSVPAFRIQYEQDGQVSLRRKRYEFWGHLDPAAATHWDPISFHPTFAEAEHRLQHITTPAVYYDKQGQRVTGQPPEQCELLGVLDEKPTSPDDSCPES